MKAGFRLASLLAIAVAAQPAQAMVIRLTNTGGVTAGSQAETGFKAAAAFWEAALTNNVTVDLNVGYSALGAGIVGFILGGIIAMALKALPGKTSKAH